MEGAPVARAASALAMSRVLLSTRSFVLLLPSLFHRGWGIQVVSP
jgi:hypothetical protein